MPHVIAVRHVSSAGDILAQHLGTLKAVGDTRWRSVLNKSGDSEAIADKLGSWEYGEEPASKDQRDILKEIPIAAEVMHLESHGRRVPGLIELTKTPVSRRTELTVFLIRQYARRNSIAHTGYKRAVSDGRMEVAKCILQEAQDRYYGMYLENAEQRTHWRDALALVGECLWKKVGELDLTGQVRLSKSKEPPAPATTTYDHIYHDLRDEHLSTDRQTRPQERFTQIEWFDLCTLPWSFDMNHLLSLSTYALSCD